ncbi:hypothetical protein FEM33_01715 [Dyadobacter flavalbus]|uniref:Uncharacterized protein n=1 Tax=Dyadobacter flavalbus TaxID=2579942 RepID=A0A5M8R1Q3_9BACT|nr:hypothetical protein [Dyadobacter flavalbus]KAA6441478.1 hypothetical protein FEM33_01715 [Dyadobacter flavalbus]
MDIAYLDDKIALATKYQDDKFALKIRHIVDDLESEKNSDNAAQKAKKMLQHAYEKLALLQEYIANYQLLLDKYGV